MSIYELDDHTIVDTTKAQRRWDEARDFDGRNMISRATGDQWLHETLYCSSKGRYYIVHTSQWQGSLPYATLASPEDAARWLMKNDHALPADLEHYAENLIE